MSLHLTAIVTAKPGKADTVKIILEDLVAQSRKETACLQYELYQSAEDENIFIFHETWASQAELDQHNEQPYLQALVSKAPELLAGPVTVHITQQLA